MALTAFDLENQFDSMVVRPAAATRIDKPKKVFAPGLHGCPHCQAQALYRSGFEELGRRLMDASSLRNLTSEPIEAIKTKLWQLNLYKEGALRPDLSTSYVSPSVKDGLVSKEQHYRHRSSSSGKPRPCSANHLHDCIARRISESIERDIKASYPDAELSMRLDKPLEPSRRRPDIQVHVGLPGCSTQVFAVELQLSPMSEEKFLARHKELDSIADSVIWVLKKKSLKLREFAHTLLFEGHRAYWLEKEEDGSAYGISLITQKDLKKEKPHRGKNSSPSVCTRAERGSSSADPAEESSVDASKDIDVAVHGAIDLFAPVTIPIARGSQIFSISVESPSVAREIRRLNRITSKLKTEHDRIEASKEPVQARRSARFQEPISQKHQNEVQHLEKEHSSLGEIVSNERGASLTATKLELPSLIVESSHHKQIRSAELQHYSDFSINDTVELDVDGETVEGHVIGFIDCGLPIVRFRSRLRGRFAERERTPINPSDIRKITKTQSSKPKQISLFG